MRTNKTKSKKARQIGATLLETAALVGLISVVAVGSIQALGLTIKGDLLKVDPTYDPSGADIVSGPCRVMVSGCPATN